MADEKKWNVLVFMADHLRHDMLGCNGNSFIRTPNVDRLASEGITFANSFTPNPICVPARASLTTGGLPHRVTGTKNNSGRIPETRPRIAAHFSDAGYDSCAMGKLHYVPYSPPDQPRLLHGFQHAELHESGRILRQFDPYGEKKGLEDYHDYLYDVGWGGYERSHGIGNNDPRATVSPLPPEHYVDSWIATRTIDYLREHNANNPDQPFFMFTSFPKPHPPYDPPEPYHKLYDPREVPPPFGDVSMLENRSPNLLKERYGRMINLLSPEGVQMSRARFMALVTFQDEMIGRVLKYLEESGLAENTIVLYTSDHGDLLGDFGSFYKTNMLNGSVRVPLIMRMPGVIPAGVERDQLVGLEDILPTLTSLSGNPLSQKVDGMDLTDVLIENSPGRDYYVSVSLESPWQVGMVCDGKRKYIYSEANGVEEFYNLEEDPDELNNLAGTETGRREMSGWRERLIAWCRENGDERFIRDGDLARTDIDSETLKEPKPGSMGWRWY